MENPAPSSISEVKPAHLDDDTERYSRSRIKTLNYESYAQLARMVKILRCPRPKLWLNLVIISARGAKIISCGNDASVG